MRRLVLPAIILSQFFCTSLWFAGNAVAADIIRDFKLDNSFLAYLTSAVQGGFICGTLLFALFTVSDRFSPARVFFTCALLAALANVAITAAGIPASGLLAARFLTGFFLAGIYPVGMKIAADYYREGLGRSMGFLVGALVLGTSFPHLLKTFSTGLPWKMILYTTSFLSVTGGLIIFTGVPDGPYRTPGQKLRLNAFLSGFRTAGFRSAAFGYFGHMWELYAFWTFLPFVLKAYQVQQPAATFSIPFLSFLVIASGGVSCALGGILSQSFGAKKIATLALSVSGTCCIFSPLFLTTPSVAVVIAFLLCWGMAATADSPLFSTLVAQSAAGETRGTSLTMVTCIGFAITVVSIQLLGALAEKIPAHYLYLLLAPGPMLGLVALTKKGGKNQERKGSNPPVEPAPLVDRG